MTKYPSLDRYLSPLSPIMCTAPPPPPIFLQPILNHQFQSFPNLYSYIPNFSSLYHFLSERKQASTIFAGFPRLFSEKRIRGKRGKWVRETKAQSNNEPGYTRDRARAFSPENPCSVSLFFKDAGTNPGRRSWWTDVGPPGASTNNGATVTGTRYIVSRESLITETLWSMTR